MNVKLAEAVLEAVQRHRAARMQKQAAPWGRLSAAASRFLNGMGAASSRLGRRLGPAQHSANTPYGVRMVNGFVRPAPKPSGVYRRELAEQIAADSSAIDKIRRNPVTANVFAESTYPGSPRSVRVDADKAMRQYNNYVGNPEDYHLQSFNSGNTIKGTLTQANRDLNTRASNTLGTPDYDPDMINPLRRSINSVLERNGDMGNSWNFSR